MRTGLTLGFMAIGALFTLLAAVGIAVAYALSNGDPAWLWAASGLLVVHWLGDSLDGTLAPRASLVRRSDEDVIENLCQVRGIGPWTVQMLLMFNFGRPDVMPATDLGVQKGVQVVYRMRKLPAPDEVSQLRQMLQSVGSRDKVA